MRLVPTGRATEVVELWDGPTVCTGCGGRLAYPHVHLGHKPCVRDGGHATKRCLDCNTLHLDPICSDPKRTVGTAYGY